jgi:hypothetical protein
MPADDVTRTKVADRRAAVLRAMAAGFTWTQIADTVDGVKTARQAAEDARQGLHDQMVLRKLAAGDRDALIELELVSLGSVQRTVEGIMRRAAADPGKGDDMALRAAQRLLQVAAKRHELLGLTHGPQAGQPADELAARRARLGVRRGTG